MTGIPADAFDFYDHLAADNSREFWSAHKSQYEQHVRDPLQALADELAPGFGPAHLYRPYRDMRFSRDKTPLKDHQGCLFKAPNGLGWYMQVSAAGFMVAGGWYQSTGEQVKRYREFLTEYGSGDLRKALDVATEAGFTVDGDQLKTRPRGVDPDAPDVDLLRHRTLHATRAWEPAVWMETADLLVTVRSSFEAIRPMIEVLGEMVCPEQ